MGSRVGDPKGMLLTHEQRAQRATGLLGAGFSLALLASGWQLHAYPGEYYFQAGYQRLVLSMSSRNLQRQADGRSMA